MTLALAGTNGNSSVIVSDSLKGGSNPTLAIKIHRYEDVLWHHCGNEPVGFNVTPVRGSFEERAESIYKAYVSLPRLPMVGLRKPDGSPLTDADVETFNSHELFVMSNGRLAVGKDGKVTYPSLGWFGAGAAAMWKESVLADLSIPSDPLSLAQRAGKLGEDVLHWTYAQFGLESLSDFQERDLIPPMAPPLRVVCSDRSGLTWELY